MEAAFGLLGVIAAPDHASGNGWSEGRSGQVFVQGWYLPVPHFFIPSPKSWVHGPGHMGRRGGPCLT